MRRLFLPFIKTHSNHVGKPFSKLILTNLLSFPQEIRAIQSRHRRSESQRRSTKSQLRGARRRVKEANSKIRRVENARYLSAGERQPRARSESEDERNGGSEVESNVKEVGNARCVGARASGAQDAGERGTDEYL